MMGLISWLSKRSKTQMPALPLSYWVTGNASVEKTDTGYTVTYPIQINDANGRKVCDDTLTVSVPSDTIKADDPDPVAIAALQDIAVLAANAAAKTKLEALAAAKTTQTALGDAAVLERITG